MLYTDELVAVWWPLLGLNQRPTSYEPTALTNGAKRPEGRNGWLALLDAKRNLRNKKKLTTVPVPARRIYIIAKLVSINDPTKTDEFVTLQYLVYAHTDLHA